MTATLTVTALTIGAAEARRIVIDCPHGTTTSHLVGHVTDEILVAAIHTTLISHVAAEGCRCTSSLTYDDGIWADLDRPSIASAAN